MRGKNEQFGRCAGAAAGNTLISRLEQRFDSIDFFDVPAAWESGGNLVGAQTFKPHLCVSSESIVRSSVACSGRASKKRAHLVPQ